MTVTVGDGARLMRERGLALVLRGAVSVSEVPLATAWGMISATSCASSPVVRCAAHASPSREAQ